MKYFYVCSYGGCGSKLLVRLLQPYGKAYHIHSRNPPDMLEGVRSEWFNGKPIDVKDEDEVFVLFIYRNPVNAILSRFTNPQHLRNIETDDQTKIEDIILSKKDLYGITEFYNNYTQPKKTRTYDILCIKYEDLFDKHAELSERLGIGELKPKRKETDRSGKVKQYGSQLSEIYDKLITEMDQNEFLITSVGQCQRD